MKRIPVFGFGHHVHARCCKRRRGHLVLCSLLCQLFDLPCLRCFWSQRKGACQFRNELEVERVLIACRCYLLLTCIFCTSCFCLIEKAGICCCNLECCCKPGAPCLFPFCCLGIKTECDGCSVVNAQVQVCCLVVSAAVPCNEEVPLAVSVLGLTCYPTCGCCVQQKEIMNR